MKVLTVFGATGQQGSSVINAILDDPLLNQQYQIRGITRDPSKPASQALRQRGVEVVKADIDDGASLKEALAGSNTVFIVTATIFDDDAKTRELRQGRAMADAAVAAGAELLLFSTLPKTSQISQGKYSHVVHFDAKAEIEEYIRTLPVKSSFVAPGSFMQNLQEGLKPRPVGDGTYAIVNCFAPETKFPLVNALDVGKWVGAILAEPEKFVGKVVVAATKVYSMEAIVGTMTEVMGKPVGYQQVPEEVIRGFLPSHMTVLIEDMVDMAFYFQDFGYYGPNMEELVKIGSAQARGRLSTLEEFLASAPIL